MKRLILSLVLLLLSSNAFGQQAIQTSISVNDATILAALNVSNMDGMVCWDEATSTPYIFDVGGVAGANDIAGTGPQGGAWMRAIDPTPGIDDILAQAQQLTTNRAIETNGNSLSISDSISAGDFTVSLFSTTTISSDTLTVLSVTANADVTITNDVAVNTPITGAFKLPSGVDPDSDVTTPTNGQLKYDSTDHDIRAYVNGTWTSLFAASRKSGQDNLGTTTATATTITATAGTFDNDTITLDRNITLTYDTTGAVEGEYHVVFVQDGGGGNTITFPAGWIGTAPVVDLAGGGKTLVTLYFDGTDVFVK